MSKSNQKIAEMRLIRDPETGHLHVDTEIFVDDVVGPEELIAMFGHGVWDLLKQSQWPEVALKAKANGVTDEEWATFESNMDFIVAGELHQYMMSVVGGLMLPSAFDGEAAMTRFREAVEWTSEYVAQTKEESKIAKEQFEAALDKED